MAGENKITVAVEAESSRLAGQLDNAAAIVNNKTRQIGDAAEKNDPMKRWFKREQIAFTMHSIGHLAEAFAGLHKAMRTGDVTAYVQAIESLPIGIGQAAQGIHALYDELSGFNEKMTELDKMTARQNTIQSRKEAAANERTRAVRSTEDADLQRQLLEADKSGWTEEKKARLQRDFDINRAREDADKKERELNDKQATADLEREFEAKRSLAEAQYADARRMKNPERFIESATTALGQFRFAAAHGNDGVDAQMRTAKATDEVKKEVVKHTDLLKQLIERLKVFL